MHYSPSEHSFGDKFTEMVIFRYNSTQSNNMSKISDIKNMIADATPLGGDFFNKLEERHPELWGVIDTMCQHILKNINGETIVEDMAGQNVQAPVENVDWDRPTTEEMTMGQVMIQRFPVKVGCKSSVTHIPLSGFPSDSPATIGCWGEGIKTSMGVSYCTTGMHDDHLVDYVEVKKNVSTGEIISISSTQFPKFPTPEEKACSINFPLGRVLTCMVLEKWTSPKMTEKDFVENFGHVKVGGEMVKIPLGEMTITTKNFQ